MILTPISSMLALASVSLAISSPGQAPAKKPVMRPKPAVKLNTRLIVYIGTYTDTGSKGVYVYEMEKLTGRLNEIGTGPFVKSPSFLAIHPSGKYLYAVNETADFNAAKEGGVTAFAINQTDGMLTLLNQQSSGGTYPCFVGLDKKGTNALIANYGSGNLEVVPIQPTGKLGSPTSMIQHTGSSVNKARQEGPHAHSINVNSANNKAYAVDLGTDRVYVYPFDPVTHTLSTAGVKQYKSAPGSGPRHLTFHPNGKNFYVINELGNSISVMINDPKTGADGEVQRIGTLPPDFKGSNTTAEVQVHPNGKFVYGSNRGHDSIAIYSADPVTGRLTYLANQSVEGKTPRNFRIDPSGHFMLVSNQDSDNVVVLKIDPATGLLSSTGTEISIPRPVCVKFLELPIK